eukprot:evm.model.NODE_4411_length_24991_cov_22.225641.3
MANIPCARAQEIRSFLAPAARRAEQQQQQQEEKGREGDVTGDLVLQAVVDLLELADDVGCPGVEIMVDERVHDARGGGGGGGGGGLARFRSMSVSGRKSPLHQQQQQQQQQDEDRPPPPSSRVKSCHHLNWDWTS